MAACICPKCGAKKNSLEQDCFYCSFKASTDNDKALALALSEPFSTPEQLAAYAKQIKRKLPLQLDMNVFASCYADVVAAREAEERESSDGSAAPPAFPTQAGSAARAPAGAAAPNPAAFLNSPAAANRAYGPDPAAAASGASGAPPASSFPFLAAPAAFSPQPNAMGGLGGGGAAGPLAANGSIFGPAPAPAPEFPGLPPVYPWDPAWFDAPGAGLSSGDELDALPEGFSLRADAPQSPRAGRLGPGARGAAAAARQSARPNGTAPFMPKGGDETNRGTGPSNASEAIGAQAIVAPPALLSPISPLQTADAASLFVGAAFSRAPGQKKRRDRRKSAGAGAAAGDSIREAKGKARPSEKPNRRARPLLDASGPTVDRLDPKPANPAPDGAATIDVEGGEPLPTLDVWGQSPQTERVRAPSPKREAGAERKPSQEQGHRQGTKREQGQTGTARGVQNKTANRDPSLGADADADADADARAKNVFGAQGDDSSAETKLGPDKSALQANRTPNRSASRFDDAGEEPSLDYSGIGVEAWAKADSIDSPFASRNPGKTEGPAASPAPDAESRVEASAATSATPLEPRPPKNEPKADRLEAWAQKSAPDDRAAGLAEPASDRAIEHGASAEAAAAPTGSGESILAPQSIAAAFARKEREMQERELFRPETEQPAFGAASAVGADADSNFGIENKNKNETATLEPDAALRAHSQAAPELGGADASFVAAQDLEETGGKALGASGDAVSEQFRIEDRGKAKSAASESETETRPVDAIEIGGWPPIPSAVDADVGLDVDIRVDSIAQNAQSGAFGRERFDLENDSARAPDDRLEQTNAAPFPGFDLSHDDPAQRGRVVSAPSARSADSGSFPGQAEDAPGADDRASGILPPPGFADSLAFEIAPPSGLGETGEDPSASPDGANVRGERNNVAASEERDEARAGFKVDGEGLKAVEAGGSEAPAFRSDGADAGLGAEAQSDAKNWERAPEKNDSPLRAAPKPKSDVPLDSLRSNPFYLLGASLRDGKEAIDRKSELLALRRAADDHSRLANEIANRPDARDAAELAWLPGASAEAERALRAKLEETPPLGSVGWDGSGAENLPLLALCNVLAAKIQIEGAASAQGARATCMALARLMEGVVAEDVAQTMAGHRAQAGAADPTSPERFGSFREALETHRQRIALDVGRAIGASVADSDFLERLAREATQDGAILAPALIERMAAARDAALAGAMEKSLASAQAIAERYSVDDEGSRPGALPCARSLARLTEQWFQAAAPILLCQKPRCAFHRRTARFAQTIARFIDAAIVDANVLAKELFDLDDALIGLADAAGPAVQDLAGALTICADLAEKLRRRVYLGKLDGQVEQIEQDAEAALEDLLDSAAPILEPPQT